MSVSLETRALSVRFGGHVAVDAVSWITPLHAAGKGARAFGRIALTV